MKIHSVIFRPFLVEFDFLVSDVKKVDTANHLVTLELKMSMEWLDGRLSCWSQVRPGYS